MESISAISEPIAAPISKVEFRHEVVTESLCEEFLPLLVMHYNEIAHYKDIELKPDFEKYIKLDQMGILRVYTSRKKGLLIGYAVFLVQKNMHYSDSLQALQDIIYINPEHRGNGFRFIIWCDEQLKHEGVEVVYHHVKEAHPALGVLLERLGYNKIDSIYGKRL